MKLTVMPSPVRSREPSRDRDSKLSLSRPPSKPASREPSRTEGRLPSSVSRSPSRAPSRGQAQPPKDNKDKWKVPEAGGGKGTASNQRLKFTYKSKDFGFAPPIAKLTEFVPGPLQQGERKAVEQDRNNFELACNKLFVAYSSPVGLANPESFMETLQSAFETFVFDVQKIMYGVMRRLEVSSARGYKAEKDLSIAITELKWWKNRFRHSEIERSRAVLVTKEAIASYNFKELSRVSDRSHGEYLTEFASRENHRLKEQLREAVRVKDALFSKLYGGSSADQIESVFEEKYVITRRKLEDVLKELEVLKTACREAGIVDLPEQYMPKKNRGVSSMTRIQDDCGSGADKLVNKSHTSFASSVHDYNDSAYYDSYVSGDESDNGDWNLESIGVLEYKFATRPQSAGGKMVNRSGDDTKAKKGHRSSVAAIEGLAVATTTDFSTSLKSSAEHEPSLSNILAVKDGKKDDGERNILMMEERMTAIEETYKDEISLLQEELADQYKKVNELENEKTGLLVKLQGQPKRQVTHKVAKTSLQQYLEDTPRARRADSNALSLPLHMKNNLVRRDSRERLVRRESRGQVVDGQLSPCDPMEEDRKLSMLARKGSRPLMVNTDLPSPKLSPLSPKTAVGEKHAPLWNIAVEPPASAIPERLIREKAQNISDESDAPISQSFEIITFKYDKWKESDDFKALQSAKEEEEKRKKAIEERLQAEQKAIEESEARPAAGLKTPEEAEGEDSGQVETPKEAPEVLQMYQFDMEAEKLVQNLCASHYKRVQINIHGDPVLVDGASVQHKDAKALFQTDFYNTRSGTDPYLRPMSREWQGQELDLLLASIALFRLKLRNDTLEYWESVYLQEESDRQKKKGSSVDGDDGTLRKSTAMWPSRKPTMAPPVLTAKFDVGVQTDFVVQVINEKEKAEEKKKGIAGKFMLAATGAKINETIEKKDEARKHEVDAVVAAHQATLADRSRKVVGKDGQSMPRAWGFFVGEGVIKMVAGRTLNLRVVLKLITSIYLAKIEQDNEDDAAGVQRQSLEEFVVDYFLAKYSLRKMAEKRILEIYQSIRKLHADSVRVYQFGQFCDMFDPVPEDRFNFFLRIFKLAYDRSEETPDGLCFLTVPALTKQVVSMHSMLTKELRDQILEGIKPLVDSDMSANLGDRVTRQKKDDEIELDHALDVCLKAYKDHETVVKMAVTKIFHSDYVMDGAPTYEDFSQFIRRYDEGVSNRKILQMYRECTEDEEGDGKMTGASFLRVMGKHNLLNPIARTKLTFI